MAELRDYQEDLRRKVERVLDADAGARVMMQLPTGGGKTVIAGELLNRRLTDGRKAVWLTHRRELADQTSKMLNVAHVSAMADISWNPGTDAPAMSGGVVILMAQTVGRRTDRMEVWNSYDARDLMIIDEAHHATADSWKRAMEQWPGPVVGMTATPWRLSEKEGFDRLFQGLILGPQVADLQSDGWLCDAKVLIPSEDGRVLGGAIGSIGDYTESGIESANLGRDVMTAGALRFWQEYAHDRQTIVYAVSVDHAHNLERVFTNAGIPAAVLLGDTGSDERARSIAGFKDGSLKVLVNVLVATEGFDLPDASCVVITRPTLSLALFMQMVGRGLRPKDDGGDCLVLDLAANTLIHGLPEERREWSLAPRGKQPSDGEAPVVRCEKCAGVSAAASHNCAHCGEPFGKECGRCGKWRAWQRWQFENHCGDAHETVCDHCHIDAHEQTHLPVTPPLDELADLADEEEDMEMNSELTDRLASVLREFLEQEQQRVMGPEEVRQRELTQRIQTREGLLNDSHGLYDEFVRYVDHLPYVNRPQNEPQRFRMYERWVTDLKTELGDWRDQLGKIKDSPADKELIFANAQNEVTRLLKREAKDAGLLPGEGAELPQVNVRIIPDDPKWIPLSVLRDKHQKGMKPKGLLTPDGEPSVPIGAWRDLPVEVANWLIKAGRPPLDKRTEDSVGGKSKRDPGNYKKLSNGRWLYVNHNPKDICRLAVRMIKETGDPVEFYVELAP